MRRLLTLALLTQVAACATIARHTTQDLAITSSPPGASVQASNGMSCDATPCTLHKVKREAHFTLTLTKPGYQTATVHITHHTSPAGAAAMAGTVALPGGLAMALVDANFGATQDLTPSPVNVTLTLAQATASN